MIQWHKTDIIKSICSHCEGSTHWHTHIWFSEELWIPQNITSTEGWKSSDTHFSLNKQTSIAFEKVNIFLKTYRFFRGCVYLIRLLKQKPPSGTTTLVDTAVLSVYSVSNEVGLTFIRSLHTWIQVSNGLVLCQHSLIFIELQQRPKQNDWIICQCIQRYYF